MIAEDFNRTRQMPWGELIVLTERVKEGDNLLDLGCGNGRLLKALPDVNFTFLGVDANAFLIQQAQQDFPDSNFEIGEMPELKLEENSYDKVFLIASFHHLIDHQERILMLEKIYASLKPGGSLMMTNWNVWQPRYWKYIFKWFWKKLAWNDLFIPWKGQSNNWVWRYYHGFTQSELERLLQSVGFRQIEQSKARHNYLTIAKK